LRALLEKEKSRALAKKQSHICILFFTPVYWWLLFPKKKSPGGLGLVAGQR